MGRVKLRLLCCRCGRVQRFTTRANEAFSKADDLMRRRCPSARCNSRDLRLELRPVAS